MDMKATPDWFSANESMGIYDAGEIKYSWALLSGLRDKVPPPQFPHHEMAAKATIAETVEDFIDADMEKVFEAIFDLDKRAEWGEGIKSIEMLNHDKINRVGTMHRCIIKSKNNPVIVTESASLGKDKMELVEMVNSGMGGCRYKLERKSPGTRMVVEILVKKNPFIKLMFGLMMKNKFRKNMQQSIKNLKAYLAQEVHKEEVVPA